MKKKRLAHHVPAVIDSDILELEAETFYLSFRPNIEK